MAVSDSIEMLIERLRLQPHPEGGWYRETFRSSVRLPIDALPEGYDRAAGDSRCVMTSIVFLLPAGVRTRWHRVRSEERFVHHRGDNVRLLLHEPADSPGDDDGDVQLLGAGDAAEFQVVEPSMWWQAAEVADGPHGYSLLGCVVAPGFEFADFEMVDD